MSEGLLSKWENLSEERTYLFGREMITDVKLHIFRQIAPIYTKNVMLDSDFV